MKNIQSNLNNLHLKNRLVSIYLQLAEWFCYCKHSKSLKEMLLLITTYTEGKKNTEWTTRHRTLRIEMLLNASLLNTTAPLVSQSASSKQLRHELWMELDTAHSHPLTLPPRSSAHLEKVRCPRYVTNPASKKSECLMSLIAHSRRIPVPEAAAGSRLL